MLSKKKEKNAEFSIKFLLTLGLAIYYGLISVQLKYLTNYFASQIEGDRSLQAVSIISFVVLVPLSALYVKGALRLNYKFISVLLMVSMWFSLTTIWSISPDKTIVYSVLTLIFCMAGVCFWIPSDDARSTAAIVTCLTIILCLVYLSSILPIRARTIGWITPNLIGHFGMSIICLAYLSKGIFRITAIGLGSLIALFSQSRAVILAILFFMLIYHFVLPNIRNIKSIIMFSILAAFVISASLYFNDVLQGLLLSILGIDDAGRGVDSGFSGRTGHWEMGIELLSENPFTGYGFRTRGDVTEFVAANSNAHSGLLNAALDTGCIGLVLYSSLYIFSVVKAFQVWFYLRSKNSRIVASYLLAYLSLLLVEPNYFGFAHPTSFLFIIFLMYAAHPEDIPEKHLVRRPARRLLGRLNSSGI